MLDREQARIVELRFFSGLTVEETAFVLKRSPTTIEREWRLAKACFAANCATTNLVVISALITVGPVAAAIKISTAAVAAALPLNGAGIFLLRLIKDLKEVGIYGLTVRASRERVNLLSQHSWPGAVPRWSPYPSRDVHLRANRHLVGARRHPRRSS